MKLKKEEIKLKKRRIKFLIFFLALVFITSASFSETMHQGVVNNESFAPVEILQKINIHDDLSLRANFAKIILIK